MKFEPDVSEAGTAFLEAFFDNPIKLADVIQFIQDSEFSGSDPFEVFKWAVIQLETMYMRWEDE